MQLNLPIFDQVSECKNLLIAGMGGGFDVFCGLPIYFELKRRGLNVHLANLSFSDVPRYKGGVRLSKSLVGVTAEYHLPVTYFPELYLSHWFAEIRGEQVTVWCFETTGARILLENYQLLTEHLAIDGILLIDGGVDSLIRGDEAGTGTLVEDAISLYSVNQLNSIPVRLMACIGFGAELDIAYAHILENIAHLAQQGAFLGSCSLVPQMESYRDYEEALVFVQENPLQDPSVINSSIISAVQGHYGNYHLTDKTRGSSLWISPLMPIYWFFDLPLVAQQNYWIGELGPTEVFMHAMVTYTRKRRESIQPRVHRQIPLT